MNIIFFSRFYYPHIGGVERHVYEISKRLSNKGYSVTIVTEKFNSVLANYELHESIKIYRITTTRNEKYKKFLIWKWLFKNRHLINDAEIIHCHDVFYWYLPFRFLYPFKKVFTTFHGYEGNKTPDWKSKFNHKIAEILSRGNICVGDYLKKWYGTRPDYVTYGAVNPSYKSNVFKRNSVVFVGRLEKEANIMNYLKALKMLKDKKINLTLIVFGDGSLRKKAEKFATDNKLNVVFKGFVRDAFQYIHKYEYVFTSRFLGTLEALSMKKFVFVVYNTPILKDCFSMSPFKHAISISGNHRELSRNIQYYKYNKNIIGEKIRLGYNWVKHQTWDEMTEMYLNLWRK